MNPKKFVAGAVIVTAVGMTTATVHADPKPDMEIALTCDGEVYDVVVAGNGAWVPAHDLNSTLVGVPIAFGQFDGVFTPTGGEPETFTDPPFAKPNQPKTRNLIIECSFTVTGEFPDGTFTGTGPVTLMVPRIHG